MPLSQVQTHLENPTKYHIQQAQRQQVKEYLSHTLGNNVASQKLGTSPSAVTGSAPELAPAANSTPSSPMAVLSLSPNKEEVGDLATALTSGRWSVAGCGRFLESTPLHVLACHAATSVKCVQIFYLKFYRPAPVSIKNNMGQYRKIYCNKRNSSYSPVVVEGIMAVPTRLLL